MRGKTRMVKKWLCLMLAAAMLPGMLPGRNIVRAQTETPVRTGENLDDDIVDQIFSQFCIGK